MFPLRTRAHERGGLSLHCGAVARAGRYIRLVALLLPALALAAPANAQPAPQRMTSPNDPTEIWEHVSIYRDGWGTPHIIADDLFTMAFGFGYAQADDHIEAMMMAYRVANGMAAEVMGESLAASDAFAIKMRHADLAREALLNADPVTIDLCEGFAAGVNAWLIDHPTHVPEWIDGARPEDVLALLHCYLMSFAPFDWDSAYARPPAAVSGNAWAVGPSKSETGEAMLFINPHTDYDGPFQWCEAHLIAPDLNVAGCTLFGLPLIMQGHNEALGWALTPNWPDFADVYIEGGPQVERDPKSMMKPQYSPELLLEIYLAQRTRKFLVKTPGGMEERPVACLETPRGPVVGRYENGFCSYAIGGYGDFGVLLQLIQMGAAGNLNQFQRALDMHQLPCFHITYADREGNIFYVYNAKFHEKHPPGPTNADGSGPVVDWTKPVPVGSSLYAWGAPIPPRALPALVNPDSGYIQACGNPPWTATENSGLWAAEWPNGFATDEDTFRARRARRLLGLGQRAFHEIQAMAYDVLVPFGMAGAPSLIEAAKTQTELVAKLHPDLAGGLEELRNWNYVAEPDSTGMTFFHVWMAALQTLAPDVGSESHFDALFQARPEKFQEASLRAAGEAAKLMRNEYGSLSVPWSEVHRIRRGAREEGIGGCGSSVFVASDYAFEQGKWWTTYGYGYAMAVKFGETPEAVSVLPFGTSEVLDSPHYDDQLDLLIDRRFKVTWFLEEDVQRQAQNAFGREVVLRPLGMEAVFTLRSDSPITARAKLAPQLPGPLPEGKAPFSVAVTLERAPKEAPIAVEMDIAIPPELCEEQDLAGLAVYAYHPTQGWKRLPNQRLEEARVLSARDRAPRTYAVLGPGGAVLSDTPVAFHVPKPGNLLGADMPPSDPKPTRPEVPRPRETSPSVPMPKPRDMEALGQSQPSPEDKGPPRAPIAWGRVIDLAAPGMGGAVQVRAGKSIGARLVVSGEPPAPLPDGRTAFTGFLEVECSEPRDIEGITVTLSLGERDGQDLSGLQVCAYDPAQGWIPLADQTIDAANRAITALDVLPRTYAILGPAPAASQEGAGAASVSVPSGADPLKQDPDPAKAQPTE